MTTRRARNGLGSRARLCPRVARGPRFQDRRISGARRERTTFWYKACEIMPTLMLNRSARGLLVALALAVMDCSSAPRLGSSAQAVVYQRGELDGNAVAKLMLRRELCEGEALRPEHERLDEADLARFLAAHHVTVNVERPRPDLAYVTLLDPAGRPGQRLRVAILATADDAGRELAEALAQHGDGAWGVHRANLAVLGSVNDLDRSLGLMARTKLACWGVFTIASGGDVYVIPGGYREL